MHSRFACISISTYNFYKSIGIKKKKKKKYGHFSQCFAEYHEYPLEFYLVESSFIRPSILFLRVYILSYSVIELAFAGDSGFIVVSNYVQSDVVSYILCRADVAFGIQQIQQ